MKNKVKQFDNYILSLGGIPQANWLPHSYEIETIYGKLRVSIHDSDHNKDGSVKKNHHNFVSIFTRFDSELARDYVIQSGGNRFSLKNNYHQYGENDIQEIWDVNFERFKVDFENILVDNSAVKV